MKKIVCLSLAVLFLAMFYQDAFSSTVYLKNGSQKKGKIVKQDDKKVVLEIGKGEDSVEITYFMDEVTSVADDVDTAFVPSPTGAGFNIPQQNSIIPNASIGQGSIFPPVQEMPKLVLSQPQEQNKEVFLEEPPQVVTQETPEVTQEPPQETAEAPVAADASQEKEKKTIEELMPLLNKEELDYYTRIDGIAKEYAQTILPKLSGTSAVGQSPDKRQEVLKEIPQDVDGVIAKIKALQVPELFTSLNQKHLENFTLIRDMFTEISNGDMESARPKMVRLQSMGQELTGELEKALEKKKQEKKT